MRFRRHIRNGSGKGRRNLKECSCESGNLALDDLGSGRHAEVCSVCAGAKARTRLASLGLIPGTRLHVVTNSGMGPLLLSLGESRLILERGVAAKVMVQVA